MVWLSNLNIGNVNQRPDESGLHVDLRVRQRLSGAAAGRGGRGGHGRRRRAVPLPAGGRHLSRHVLPSAFRPHAAAHGRLRNRRCHRQVTQRLTVTPPPLFG